MEKSKGKIKFCIVSSCGGHLAEVRALKPVYDQHEHFYVLNDKALLPDDMQGRTFFIRHSERDLLFFINLWEAWRILRRERPSIMLSTGAGLIVPFTLVGKLLGIPTIYIEISAQVADPSLTGRIMYHLADKFFYQWRSLECYFPNGIYGGLVLWSS